MADKPAADKRTKISKAYQLTMLEVLGASLILGTCLVLVNFIIQYINFNARVLTAKNEAMSEYDQALRNIGVCVDTNNDKHLSDQELEACNPNEVKLSDVVGSLRYKVFEELAQNSDLETVARKRNSDCYDEDGNRFDFNKLYEEATSDTEREVLLQATKVCSSLRVIPDALPAQKNVEALMASLNQLFIVSEWEPESLAPRDDKVEVDNIEGVSVIPVTLSVNGDGQTIIRVLKNINRSIREFDVTSMRVEWTQKGLDLRAQANAFYFDDFLQVETTKTMRAGDKK